MVSFSLSLLLLTIILYIMMHGYFKNVTVLVSDKNTTPIGSDTYRIHQISFQIFIFFFFYFRIHMGNSVICSLYDGCENTNLE